MKRSTFLDHRATSPWRWSDVSSIRCAVQCRRGSGEYEDEDDEKDDEAEDEDEDENEEALHVCSGTSFL